MSPCNMDLAKNLILSGINITIFDDEKITEEDFEDNPLIKSCDIGKNVRLKNKFLYFREVKLLPKD